MGLRQGCSISKSKVVLSSIVQLRTQKERRKDLRKEGLVVI